MNQVEIKEKSLERIVLDVLLLSGLGVGLIVFGITLEPRTVIRVLIVFYGIVVIGWMAFHIVGNAEQKAENAQWRRNVLNERRLDNYERAEKLGTNLDALEHKEDAKAAAAQPEKKAE